MVSWIGKYEEADTEREREIIQPKQAACSTAKALRPFRLHSIAS